MPVNRGGVHHLKKRLAQLRNGDKVTYLVGSIAPRICKPDNQHDTYCIVVPGPGNQRLLRDCTVSDTVHKNDLGAQRHIVMFPWRNNRFWDGFKYNLIYIIFVKQPIDKGEFDP